MGEPRLAPEKGDQLDKETVLIFAGVGLVVGVWLLMDSQCTGNCRTVAKYLTQHSTNSLLFGLFAA